MDTLCINNSTGILKHLNRTICHFFKEAHPDLLIGLMVSDLIGWLLLIFTSTFLLKNKICSKRFKKTLVREEQIAEASVAVPLTDLVAATSETDAAPATTSFACSPNSEFDAMYSTPDELALEALEAPPPGQQQPQPQSQSEQQFQTQKESESEPRPVSQVESEDPYENIECLQQSSQPTNSSGVDCSSAPQKPCAEETNTHPTNTHEEEELAKVAEVAEAEYENVRRQPHANTLDRSTSTSTRISQAKAIARAAQARQSELDGARAGGEKGDEEERSEDPRRRKVTWASEANGFAAGGVQKPIAHEGEDSTAADLMEEGEPVYSQVIRLSG